MTSSVKRVAAALFLVAASQVPLANGDSTTLTEVESGSIGKALSFYFHYPDKSNPVVNVSCSQGWCIVAEQTLPYFIFDLATVTEPAVGGSISFSTNSITADIALTVLGGASATTISDLLLLPQGTLPGTFPSSTFFNTSASVSHTYSGLSWISASSVPKAISFDLNYGAIRDINAAGGLIQFGLLPFSTFQGNSEVFVAAPAQLQLVHSLPDADADGADSIEESLAGTGDNDPTQRPYWFKTFEDQFDNDFLGSTVSGAGDVNNDGHDDVIIGATGRGSNGSSFVFSGANGGLLYIFEGDASNDAFGYSSGAGDVNGDGFDDLIVGTGSNVGMIGYARVYSGADGSVLYNFVGDNSRDWLGAAVSGAGDVNGDGYADVIAGAPQLRPPALPSATPGNGYARVFSGTDGSILHTFHGDDIDDQFGLSVSGAGDVNGDGKADLIVGARQDDNNGSNSGSARVFSGADGSILYTFNGDHAGELFGRSVGGAGDVNADGFADVIVAAQRSDPDGLTTYSRIFSGENGNVLYTLNSGIFGNRLVRDVRVSGVGDVDADGHTDLALGSLVENNTSPTRQGRKQVFSGDDSRILYTFESAFDDGGAAVSGAGDVDGDGYADLILGSSYSGRARLVRAADLANDPDLDTIANTADNCLQTANTDQADTDHDGVGDACDNCVSIANPGQEVSAVNPDCGQACETAGCAGVNCANH